MNLIEWNSSVSMGIEEIDIQHKKLVDILNNFFNSMMNGKAYDVLETTFNELLDYGIYHFATEEKYFEKFNYEYAEEHIAEHKFFINKIKELKKSFDNGDIQREGSDKVLTVELWDFLKKWLVNHIKVDDHKYSKLFKENGL